MECRRCNGMMVGERFYGPGDPFWGWRCIQCGEIFDVVILENRSQSATAEGWSQGASHREKPNEAKRRAQHGAGTNTQMR
jgi:hypothetical protein